MLGLEAGQQLLAGVVEAIGQPVNAAGQHCRTSGAVGRKRDRGFGEHIVELGLEHDRALVDRFLTCLATTVRIEGQQE